MIRARITLLLLLGLAGCGGLPQPFFGNPGRNGSRLVSPPPSRLAVPNPPQSLLDDASSAAWATATASALTDRAIPAVHTAIQPGDWSLDLTATVRGDTILPTYTIHDSLGAAKGTAQGAPVPVANWSSGDPAVVIAAAQQAAPAIDTLLANVQAASLHADPNSLQNRPARVYISGVTGAPGDGDRSLLTQIRLKLAANGIVVQDTPEGADYRVRAEVTATPAPADQLKVELQWVVDDAKGERGRVIQLNEVPRQAVQTYWGDVAVVAADQAATGIKEVFYNAAGPRLPTTTPTPAK